MRAPKNLSEILAKKIAAEGAIGMDDYMRAALTHPDCGYYQTRDPLGAGGDFLTAPEASQVFGEMVGLYCGHLWERMGSPQDFIFAELGPGRGSLMQDALRALSAALPACLEAATIAFVESSPLLQKIQARAHPQAVFYDSFSDLPPAPFLLIANEFFDALPIRQYVRKKEGFYERRVSLEKDSPKRASLEKNFVPVLQKHSPSPPPFAKDAPLESIIEISPEGEALASQIGRRCGTSKGAALIIDYGYADSHFGDSVQAVRNHQPHPVFHSPGEADISAHVNFHRLKKAAEQEGAHVAGPVGQGVFLRRLGALERFHALMKDAPPSAMRRLARQARRLMAPEEMGRLFKVMAITSHDGSAQNGEELLGFDA